MTASGRKWHVYDAESAQDAERTAESRLRERGVNAALLAKTKQGSEIMRQTLAKLRTALEKRYASSKPKMPSFTRQDLIQDYERRLSEWTQMIEQRKQAILTTADFDNKELEAYWGEDYSRKSKDITAINQIHDSIHLIGLASEYSQTEILPARYITKALTPEQCQASFKEGWASVPNEIED